MAKVLADLSDLTLELWLRRRERGLIVWKTQYGTLMDISQMSDKHLINTIKYIMREEGIREIVLENSDVIEKYY